jgi:hypothetical protein
MYPLRSTMTPCGCSYAFSNRTIHRHIRHMLPSFSKKESGVEPMPCQEYRAREEPPLTRRQALVPRAD